MSTILKALRRLEHERSSLEGRPLRDEVAAPTLAPSRRRTPLLALLAAVGALGLGLGASLLWLWPHESSEPVQVAEAPSAPRRTALPPSPPPLPAAEEIPAAPPAEPIPVAPIAPAPVAAAPIAPAPVAAAPPPAAFASPVEVVARPKPAREPEPAPPLPAEAVRVPEEPLAPPRGSLPPYARREASAPKPAATTSRPRPSTPPEPVRASVPDVLVSKTVWHPQRDRRLALVALEGGAARELHEGDAIGPLVVSEIEPSGVVFDNGGTELRRKVGSKN